MAIRLVSNMIIWDIVFRSVKTTSSSIIGLGSYFWNTSDTTKTDYDLLDLESEINIIKLYLTEINSQNQRSIGLAIESINHIIEKIEYFLSEIKNKRQLHNQKWFSYYRTIDYSDEYKKIFNLYQILNKRLMLLKQLS